MRSPLPQAHRQRPAHPLTRRGALLGSVAAALLATAPSALGCTFPAPLPGTPIAGDIAVAGTVTGIAGDPTSSPAPILTLTVRVDTVLRGAPGEVVEVLTYGGSCSVPFATGGRYLLFASVSDGTDASGFPAGALGTGPASGVRPLAPAKRVGPEDLLWPAPTLEVSRSNMTPRELIAFRAFPAYWLGGAAPGVSGALRSISRSGGAVRVVYRQDAVRGVRVTTRRVCPGTGAARLTGLRRMRGVPVGFRGGGISVFTGHVEVRVNAHGTAAEFQAVRGIFAGSARTTTLPPPVHGEVGRLVPCPL